MIFTFSKYCLFLLLLFPCQSVFGQDPAYHQLTDEDGLPSLTVYKILQSQDGYIWMGTSNGICRYDGKEFKHYSDRRMKDKEIINLEFDTYNNIWFRNLSDQLFCINNGEIKLFDDLVNEKFNLVRSFGILDNYIYVIAKDDKETIDNRQFGINRFKILEDGTIGESFTFQETFFSPSAFIISKKGLLINLRKSLKEQYRYFEFHNHSDVLDDLVVDKYAGEYLKYSKPFYHEGEKLILYDSKNRILREVSKTDEKILLKPDENNLISAVSKLNEIYYILTKKGLIITPTDFSSNSTVFEGIICNSFFVDREQNIWIGTTESGILFIPSLKMKLYNAKNSSLPSDQIFSLSKNKKNNEIIIGQNNGQVSIFNNNEILNFNLNASGRVRGIYQSKENDDYFFIGTDSKSYFTKKNINNAQPLFSTFSEYRASVKTFFQDDEKNIYFGESKNLRYRDHSNSSATIFSFDKTIFNKRTYAVAQDYSKSIWIGTTEGIYIKKDSSLEILNPDDPILYNVSSFTQTNDSIMWVATLGDGLLGYKNYKEIYHFDQSNGLASNACKKVYAQGDDLLVATDKGLNILNYKTKAIQLINKTDGFPTNDVNDIAFVDNEIWVGTSKGLLNFPFDLGHTNLVAPQIHITAFKIWEKDTILEKTFALNYDQNNFQIEFVGLGFRARGNIKYQYKLSGADSDWVTTDARVVRYPSLNPGDYTFEVYAINEDGMKSESPATFSLQISPPYWQTWWFRILTILLSASLIGLFFYWRFKKIREKESFENEYIQKVNELEQKALQLQMNPHFIYNTLNAIQYFLTINDSKFAMLYLSRFAKMIRTIFEQSKHKVINLEEEIDFLKLYLNLEQLRFDNKIDVDLQISENLEGKLFDIKIPPLLLQPLIENSFKHGLFQKEGKGTIKIHFDLENQFLLCIIEDDGVGRKEAANKDEWKPKNYVSSGINNTKDRLAILNNLNNDSKEESNIEIIDLYDESNIPSGTKVIVKIRYENA